MTTAIDATLTKRNEMECRAQEVTREIRLLDAKIGELLRIMRLDHNVSLRGIARAIGFSAPYVADIERGRRTPSADFVRAYAEAINAASATAGVIR